MFKPVLLILLYAFLTGLPCNCKATDWVFKGQPKDGSEHYHTPAAEESSRAQRAKLVADCDSMLSVFAPHRTLQSLPDPSMKRAAMLGLSSCGLVYGVDHQKEKANECLNRALELAQSSGDAGEQARILNNLGIVHALWGQSAIALDDHKRSLALSANNADLQNQAISYNQIGQIAMFMGDYRKASDALNKSLTLQSTSADNGQLWLTWDNLGQLNEAWGNYDKALQCYQQGLQIKKKAGLTGGEAASHVLLGRVHKALEKDEEAVNSFQKALNLCRKHGYPTDLVVDHIGNLYLDRHDTQRAEAYIKQAGFWQSLGRFYLTTGDLSTADRNYVKLLNYSEPRRMLDYLWVAHTGLGAIREQEGDLPSAAERFRGAIQHIESIREGLAPSERAEFFNVQVGGFLRTAPYKGLARVLVKMKKSSEAFRESEFTKARTFSEGLSRRSADAMMGIPADTMSRDAALNQELAAVARALNKAYEEDDRKTITVLELQLKTAKDKLAKHVTDMRAHYPLFAATRYPQPISLPQSRLTDDEWVLAYDVTDTGIIIYLLKGTRVIKAAFKPLPRTELVSLVRQLRAPLEIEAGESPKEKLINFNFVSGRKLSDILLRDFLNEIPKDVHLIVVPDDSLAALPFEMLVLNDGGRVEVNGKVPTISGAEFFGDRNPISYYQSITALTLARTLRKQEKSSERLLAIVDPVFSTDDPRLGQTSRKEKAKLSAKLHTEILMSIGKQTGITFPRLPLTGELGEQLKKKAPSETDLYEGLQASKKVLVEKDLRKYRSVLLATHGYFGRDLPGIREPVLVLTLLGEPANEDGFLRLSEVMGLQMNCDLAALTACKTGLGRQISGEGTMGMGRAFQYAGAKSVLITLWSVSENASVRLVESFFRNLKLGHNKIESLRLARNELRKEGYDHPFYWAPFILAGEKD